MRNLRGLDGWEFLRLVAHQPVWSDYVDFLLIRESNGKPRTVCGPPQFIELPESAPIIPTFSLAAVEAQELMDALWNCGLRPSLGRHADHRL